jgi:hypothetical protein
MGLFNFLNKNGQIQVEPTKDFNSNNYESKDITEDLFIEKSPPTQENQNKEARVEKNHEQTSVINPENGISVLYRFLEKNFEAKGYDDALINPDTHHLDQNIITLKYDLERNIKKVKTFYEDFINQINFHINSRARSGMIDTVEELEMKKSIAENHITKVLEIEEDARNNRGDCQGIVMSYTRGFRNGLAAISHHSILNQKF